MHKILSVRFLLKFSHFFFLVTARVASFLLALGNLHFPYRFADSSGSALALRLETEHKYKYTNGPDRTTAYPITRVAMRKCECENVKMCNVHIKIN